MGFLAAFLKKYARFGLILLVAAAFLAGCETPAPPEQTTAPTTAPQVTQAPTQPIPTQPEVTVPPVTPEGALEALRQELAQTGAVFGVIYLGYSGDYEAADPFDLMERFAPGVCEQLPFLQTLEGAYGYPFGELYCIIPRDPGASVAVDRAMQDFSLSYVYDEAVYHSQEGQPFLLFANTDGWEPDTLVTVTDSQGSSVQWHPRRDGSGRAALPPQGILDASDYGQCLQGELQALLEAGWQAPDAAALENTQWQWGGQLPNGLYGVCRLSFREGVATVEWNDGLEDHTYADADWALSADSQGSLITFDFGNFAGTLSYRALTDPATGGLYMAVEPGRAGVDTLQEPLCRTLIPAAEPLPHPMDLVGRWQISGSEVEGYMYIPDPESSWLEIRGQTQQTLTVSLGDRDFPNSAFSDQPAQILFDALYYDCGNSLWMVQVLYESSLGTSFRLTLLEDGQILLQRYWEMDGAPMVSYQWFAPTE